MNLNDLRALSDQAFDAYAREAATLPPSGEQTDLYDDRYARVREHRSAWLAVEAEVQRREHHVQEPSYYVDDAQARGVA